MYNESYEIMLQREAIIKNPNKRILKFTTRSFRDIGNSLLLFFVGNLIFYYINASDLFINSFNFIIGILFIQLALLYKNYLRMTKKIKEKFVDNENEKGTLIIDEEGITN